MPSPFPGMNPYLEAYRWKDFHTQYLVAIRQALATELAGRYSVFSEEDLFIHEPSAKRRRKVAVADVAVSVPAWADTGTSPAATLTPSVTPVLATLPEVVAEERHRWIEIRDSDGGRLVTAIEILSPTNKVGDGRGQYLAKRHALVREANLVEIDLLRVGRRMPMEPAPQTPYCVMVARRRRRPEVELWPLGLRDVLPSVPIPLLPDDADAVLDLQSLLHATYDAAAYRPALYDRDLDPPLSPDDAAWAAGVIRPAPAGT